MWPNVSKWGGCRLRWILRYFKFCILYELRIISIPRSWLLHVPFKSYDDFKFTTNRDTKFYILSYGQLNRMSPKCNFNQQLQLLSKYFDRTYTKYHLTGKLKFSQIFTFLPIYPYISKHYLPTSASFARVGSQMCNDLNIWRN